MRLCLFLLSKKMLPMQFSQNIQRKGNYPEPYRNSKYPIRCLLWWHKTLLDEIWTQTYSEPLQASKMECSYTSSLRLKFVNWTRRNTPFWMFEGVLNMLLLKSKAGVRCPKRTLNVPKYKVNVRDICFEIFQWC